MRTEIAEVLAFETWYMYLARHLIWNINTIHVHDVFFADL